MNKEEKLVRPLEGVVVIDSTHVLAGPYCTYQLALLGAEVIKIEPPTGDLVRPWGGTKEQIKQGLGMGFVSQNAGKRSFCVDISRPEGAELVLRLCENADVFIENYRTDAISKHGLGYEDVKSVNPKIVYASLTAFGQNGPLGHRPGFDDVVQASSGFMADNRRESGPIRTGGPILDFASGMHATQSILAGLMLRDKTGLPQRIDIAMQDITMLLLNYRTALTSQNGGQPISIVQDIEGPMLGRFPAKEGFVMLAGYLPRHCCSIAAALGLSRWTTTTLEDMKNHAAEMQSDVEKKLLEKTADEWDVVFNKEGVVGAGVKELSEAFDTEQPKARQLTQPIDTAIGEIHVTTNGYMVNGEVFGPQGTVPLLGQHTREVLNELGLTDTQTEKLLLDGTVKEPSEDEFKSFPGPAE